MDGYFLVNVYALLILCILSFIFFHKKRMHKVEDVTYAKLIVFSVLTISFGLFSGFSFFANISFINHFMMVFGKFYLIGLFGIFLLFFSYTLYVSKVFSIKEDIKKKIFTIVFFVFALLIFILPFELDVIGENVVISGLSVLLTYTLFGLIYFCLIITMIFGGKKVFSKKYIPIFMFLLGGILLFVVQVWFANLNYLTNPYIVLICLIMYFTIENPDMKLIEQLEVAREQADKANRAKTDFLSSMSHEIRTPLNAIVGFSDCIMDSNTLGEAKENAHDIINASQTLLEIVNGILDISKIEAGKIEIVNSKYNALDTFEELAKLITPKMNEKGLDFTYKIAPDLPKTLFGDHANIKKVVTNLLSNACKYTEHGFVHYEVNCINTKDVCKLIISVEDSGRGIKKDSIDKLFTKFQRLDEDKNTTIEGTGLGLAITKQLIELMGGKIIVHTVYGEGSKFTVVLNQKITTEEVINKKKVKDTLDLHDIRILMVDDTPLNLKVTCKLLERYHANHIVTCDSGFECIDKIKRGEQYDIILLDDMMPKMSGVETLKILKEIPGFSIPTIALTANAITGMREKYIRDGFTDYLAKPIEKDQLIQVINQILGRSFTEDISIPVNTEETPNIRGEVIPNVDDYDSAEQDRIKNQIIPVEDNIEMILGNQLDRNYHEEEAKLNDIPIELHHFDDHEDEFVSVDEVFDKNYLIEHGVDIEEALSLLGDMDMYNMTIHDFYQDVEDKWNNIVHYKDEGNMSEYSILVHSLKSDCKYLGFMKLADISYQHELKSKENDLDFVLAHFKELEDEYHKSMEIIKNYVEHNPINE